MSGLMKLSVIVSLVDRLSGPVQRMARHFQNLERLAEQGRGMVEAGQRMAITGALVSEAAGRMRAGMLGLLDPVLEVEEAMAPLAAATTSTLGSLQASLNATLQAARDWAREHTQSAAEFIRAAYAMASAGLNDVQAIEGARVALRLATATMGDHAEAAELVATLYNNMGDKSRDLREEMGRIGDVVAKTQIMFQLRDLRQMSEGLKYAIPSAIQFGESLESVATVIGALNSAGLMGSQAGTAYAASMRQMLRASRQLGFELARTESGGIDFIETLANIRERFGDASQWSDDVAMAMQQAFGDEGMRAIALLIGQVDQLRNQLEQVRNSAGTAAAAQADMERHVRAQWRIIQNQLADVMFTLSRGLLPAIHGAVPRVRQLVQAFQRFAEAHPNLVQAAVLIAGLGAVALTVAAPIFTVISGLIMMGGYGLQAAARIGRGFMWLRGVLASARIAEQVRAWGAAFRQLAVTALEAMVRAGRATVQFAGLLVRLAASGAAAVGRMAVGLAAMGRQALLTALRAMPALIASVWSFTAALLANPITWIVLALVGLGAAIYLLIRHWNRVSEATQQAWAAVTAAVSRATEWLREHLGALVRWLAILAFPPLILVLNWDQVRQGMEQAGGFVPWAYERLKAVLAVPLRLLGVDPTALFASIDQALAWLRGKIEAFREAGSALWEAFTSGIRSLASRPMEAVRGALDWVANLLPHSDAPEGPLSTLTESGRSLALTFAAGIRSAMPAVHRAVATGLAGLALTAPAPAVAAAASGPLRVEAVQVAQVAAPPRLPPVTGEARYELAPVASLPRLPSLTGEARYSVPTMQEAAVPSLEMGAALPMTAPPPARPARAAAEVRTPAKQLVVRGDLIVHIDQVRDEEDFLRRIWLAAEEGGFE